MSRAEELVLARVLRQARPDVVRWMLPIAREMVLHPDPWFTDYCARWYRALPANAGMRRVDLDRAMGAITRAFRACGYRREARQLAAIVRGSR